MIIDNYLDNLIADNFLKEEKQRNETHISSGKLSASMLYQPLQWQVLKCKGIQQKPFDEYTLRKFFRGKMIENWLLTQIDGLQKTEKDGKQDFVEYKGVIGFVDAMVDMSNWNEKLGIIPHEIKSVSNAKFKRILQRKEADKGHLLQGALYALAKGTEYFAIDYVASDDLRVKTWIYKTADYKDEIDQIIKDFNEAMAKEEIPEFVAKENWQANLEYNNYPDWSELKSPELEAKYKEWLSNKPKA